eukprot:TRINITY_DN5062_c0_g1_i1.p1 TRINITY_DN5062_c0_g1~~TRINITY_DN5062_c0_g1_i1.p1  ORF type:complete len:979 (+),score=282.56 TRINITY_DN5062_c0_g1_i1:43-2937(+)
MASRTVLDDLLASSKQDWSEEELGTLRRLNVVMLSKVFDKLQQGLSPDDILTNLYTLQTSKEKKLKEVQEAKESSGDRKKIVIPTHIRQADEAAVAAAAAAAAPPPATKPTTAAQPAPEPEATPPPTAPASAPADDDDDDAGPKKRVIKRPGKKGDTAVASADPDEVAAAGDGGSRIEGAATRGQDKTELTGSDLLAALNKKRRPKGAEAEYTPEEKAELLQAMGIPEEMLQNLTEEEEEWLLEEAERLQNEDLNEDEDMEEKGKEDAKRKMEEEMAWEDEDDDELEAEMLAEQMWEEEQRKETDNLKEEAGEEWDDDDLVPSDDERLGEETDKDPNAQPLLEEELEQEEEYDPFSDDPVVGPKPDQVISINDVDYPAWLKPHFTVLKYDPKSPLTSRKKRVWVIDFCEKIFRNKDIKGALKKDHSNTKFLQIEKNWMDHSMGKVMFFDAHHAYEFIFRHGTDRERFYECASSLRPKMRVWCPDLCKNELIDCNTSIVSDGKTIEIDVAGQKLKETIKGETTIAASKSPIEKVKLWVGSFNLGGERPPTLQMLESWIPREGYDLLAIGVQEAHFRADIDEWYRILQKYMGRPYVMIAHMTLWDVCLCIFSKKSTYPKVANVEGHTRGVDHDLGSLGQRGATAITMRYHETSLVFINMHLVDGVERNRERNALINEIMDDLRLAVKHTDITAQFHHTFILGTLNYRVEKEYEEAKKLALAKQYAPLIAADQLRQQMQEEGIFARFQEAPITWPPTWPYFRGTLNYQDPAKIKRDTQTPSYVDRIMWKNSASAHKIECLGYHSSPDVRTSTHLPIWANFVFEGQRPFISIFGHDEKPCHFAFDFIEVTGNKSAPIKSPIIMLYCTHVDGFKHSKQLKTKNANPRFAASDLPLMKPFVWHLDFLETQHFIIMLRDGSHKSSTLQGTALLPLRGTTGIPGQLVPFDLPLEFHTREIGRVKGAFCFKYD